MRAVQISGSVERRSSAVPDTCEKHIRANIKAIYSRIFHIVTGSINHMACEVITLRTP
jgi:hypothetical protein